jgi:hypothetical protein
MKSQQDFRKLMATPRASQMEDDLPVKSDKKKRSKPSGSSSRPVFKMPTTKTVEESQSLEGYRDRARERRLGIVQDEQPTLAAGTGTGSSLLANRNMALAQINKSIESKRLKEDEALLYVNDLTNDVLDMDKDSITPFVRDIFKYALGKVEEEGPAKHNIYEGRSAFVYNLQEDLPSFLIRPKSKIVIEERGWEHDEVISSVIHIFEESRNPRVVEPIAVVQARAVEVENDEEEDIFADAGQDYVLEVDPAREMLLQNVKPTTEQIDAELNSDDEDQPLDQDLHKLLQQGQEMAMTFGAEPDSPKSETMDGIEPLDMYMEMEDSSDEEDGDLHTTLDANKRPGSTNESKGKKHKPNDAEKLNRDFQVFEAYIDYEQCL